MTRWTRLRHRLGLHGWRWRAVRVNGEVYADCAVCGARRRVPPEDAALIPAGAILDLVDEDVA